MWLWPSGTGETIPQGLHPLVIIFALWPLSLLLPQCGLRACQSRRTTNSSCYFYVYFSCSCSCVCSCFFCCSVCFWSEFFWLEMEPKTKLFAARLGHTSAWAYRLSLHINWFPFRFQFGKLSPPYSLVVYGSCLFCSLDITKCSWLSWSCVCCLDHQLWLCVTSGLPECPNTPWLPFKCCANRPINQSTDDSQQKQQ